MPVLGICKIWQPGGLSWFQIKLLDTAFVSAMGLLILCPIACCSIKDETD
jgi:hypothetical protein